MKTAATPLCRVILLLGLAFVSIGSVYAQETIRLADSSEARSLYADAESLLADGRAHNAYELLRSYESEFAGNPYFDYLLGVASLDSGRTSEAILNLQRAAAGAPNFSGARLELARAYFEAGEYGDAQQMFAALVNENPPAAVREVIDGYLNAIDSRPTVPPSRFLPYGELLTGHDSNANGSTDNQQFLGFSLSPNNVETESSFGEIGAGFNWSIPSSATAAWYVNARASYRHNPDASFVDPSVLSGLTGYTWRRGAFFGHVGVDGYWALRDGEFNEAYGGLDVLLGRRVSSRWDLTLGLRGGAMRFDDIIEVLDVDRVLYALGASFRISSLSALSIEAVGGQDSEKQVGSPYGNSKTGGRLSLTVPLGRSYLFASVGSLTSDYDGLFFGLPREDTQVTSILQIEFRDFLTEGLSLIPRVRFVDNDSDVSLYKYDRTEYGLMIRWMPR